VTGAVDDLTTHRPGHRAGFKELTDPTVTPDEASAGLAANPVS
jgi:hypothetical protein